jgi:hypothetical protein
MPLTPGVEIPFGIQPVNPVPVDSWSGPYTGSLGNDNEAGAIAAANASIPEAIRFQSMEVRLIYGGVAYKYWYRNGIADNNLILFSGGGDGSGDANAQYLVLSTTGSLINERILVVGTGISGSDAGAGGNFTLSIDDSIVATTSGSTFTGAVKFNEGLSGSLTRLIDGTSFIAAGHGISVSSSSNGNIKITSTAVTSPAGSDTQLQFNDGGSFGADNGLTYNKNSNSLFISGAVLINKLTPEYGEILSVNQVLTSSSDFVRAGSYIKQILTGPSQFGAGDPSLLYGLVVETYNKSKLESGYGITSFNSYAYHQSTSSLYSMRGYEGGASIIKPEDGNTAGNVSSAVGLHADVGFQASTNFTGSITDAYGFKYNNFGINAVRTVANSYGIKLENVGASTGVTNAIGIDIAQINTASGIKLGIRTQDPIVIGTTNIAGTEKLRVNGASRFDESANFIQGLSGSLTKLTDGTSYIVAGSNVTITSASNGAITISSLAGDITAVNAGVGLLGGGSSGNITLDINDSIVATTSGSTFTGTVKFNAGLSGSITKLTDGSSYLIAGNNVVITTGSSGAVTIEAIVAGYSKGYLYGSSQDGSGNVNVSSIGTLVNGYDAESDVDVFLNGQLLTAEDDYTVPTNTTIHFNNTLNPDDVVTVRLLTTGSSGSGNSGPTTVTESLTIDATTFVPTKATTIDQDFITIIDDGSGWCHVELSYYASNTSGASAGSGTYLYSLPGSYKFNTTTHPLNTQITSMSGSGELNKAIGTVGIVSQDNFTSFTNFVVPHSATQFKIMANSPTSLKYVGSSYYVITGNNTQLRLSFRFNKALV